MRNSRRSHPIPNAMPWPWPHAEAWSVREEILSKAEALPSVSKSHDRSVCIRNWRPQTSGSVCSAASGDWLARPQLGALQGRPITVGPIRGMDAIAFSQEALPTSCAAGSAPSGSRVRCKRLFPRSPSMQAVVDPSVSISEAEVAGDQPISAEVSCMFTGSAGRPSWRSRPQGLRTYAKGLDEVEVTPADVGHWRQEKQVEGFSSSEAKPGCHSARAHLAKSKGIAKSSLQGGARTARENDVERRHQQLVSGFSKIRAAKSKQSGLPCLMPSA